MTNVVGYFRVSTEEQIKHGQGLEIQEQEIRTYCTDNKISLVKLFIDAGLSGANDITKRKGLNDLLDYCRKNQIQQVLITKMDRLARDVYLQLWIEKELKISNTTIISIGEDNLNGDDYMTKAMRQIVGVFAELEKSRITEWLIKGRKAKAIKGVKASGSCPFGYRYEWKMVLPDIKKGPIVKEIFSLYLKGFSLQDIAKHLNQCGSATTRGNKWTPASVNLILRNDFYTGVVRFGEIVKDNAHDPLVNKITYGRVQSRLTRNNRKAGNPCQ